MSSVARIRSDARIRPGDWDSENHHRRLMTMVIITISLWRKYPSSWRKIPLIYPIIPTECCRCDHVDFTIQLSHFVKSLFQTDVFLPKTLICFQLRWQLQHILFNSGSFHGGGFIYPTVYITQQLLLALPEIVVGKLPSVTGHPLKPLKTINLFTSRIKSNN